MRFYFPACQSRIWDFARLSPKAFLLCMAYAIIKTGGRQYRVAEGDTIDVDLLEAKRQENDLFGDVLFHGDGEN